MHTVVILMIVAIVLGFIAGMIVGIVQDIKDRKAAAIKARQDEENRNARIDRELRSINWEVDDEG